MKRILRPLFGRVARSLGISELQNLIAHQETVRRLMQDELDDLRLIRAEIAEVERLVSNRVSDQVKILRREIGEASESSANTLRIEIQKLLSDRLDAAQQAVVAHSTAHAEHLNNVLRLHVDKLCAELRREIDLVRAASSKSVSIQGDLNNAPIAERTERVDDALYVAIEDHFRGSQDLVRQRQENYIHYVADSVVQDFPLVDFGCGRGEWLEILRAKGLPAMGYDSNVVCVDECTNKGLNVVHGNLIDVLNSLPDNSLGAVTFFQVFEHLPFMVLQDVIRSCCRVLRPGGVLIAEVPNSENLTVGSSTFWIDPTHERPLHPEVLRFLARQVGFSDVSGIYSTPLRQEVHIEGDGPMEVAVRDIFNTLFGPADFALVARV